ncbi:hypothetical protein ACC756_28115 [Rhizobium ruizarguesonis]
MKKGDAGRGQLETNCAHSIQTSEQSIRSSEPTFPNSGPTFLSARSPIHIMLGRARRHLPFSVISAKKIAGNLSRRARNLKQIAFIRFETPEIRFKTQ